MLELLPYQIVGSQFLSQNKYAYLGDEMGLGKSPQSITAADKIGARTILVLAMAVGRVNWQREFEKWSITPRRYNILRKKCDQPIAGCVNITSYDFLSDHTEIFKKFIWDLVISDEAHSLKNPKAKRTKAALGNSGVIRNSSRFWFLSGTPAPNNFSEMWVTLYTCGLTPLKYEEFCKYFCHVFETEHGPRITGNKMSRIPEMKALIDKFMLRRKKEKGMLPDIYFQTLFVEPAPVDIGAEDCFFEYGFPDDRRQEVRDAVKNQSNTLEQALTLGKGNIAVLEGLARSTSTLRRYIGYQKIQPVAEIVEIELDSNQYEKIVIFAHHKDVIEGLRQRLRKFNPVTLYGGKDDNDKQKAIDKFQNNPKCRVFIGNILAAGTTINLTAANQVLFAEQDWTPGNNAQAMMRVHRYGQTLPVTVRFAAVYESIDEKIAAVLKRKSKELTQIFDESLSDEEDLYPTETPEEFILPLAPNQGQLSHDAKGSKNNSLICENSNANQIEESDEIDIFS